MPSGSLALHIAITIHLVLRNRMVCQRTGTAQTITLFSRLLAAERPLTTPDEGGWGGIPATRAGFQPLDELFGSARLLSRQGTTHQNPLDGLRHIEPTPTQGGVQRHDTVRHEPADERGTLVAGEIIQDQQHP